MKPLHWTGIAVVVLAAGFWLWVASSQPSSPRSLAATALSAADAKERIDATLELAMHKEPEGRSELRRVAKESKDPEVLSRAIAGLTQTRDPKNAKVFLPHLENSDQEVRKAAYAAFRECIGIPFDVDLIYDPADSPEKRAAAAKVLAAKYAPERDAAALENLKREFALARGKRPGSNAPASPAISPGAASAPSPSVVPGATTPSPSALKLDAGSPPLAAQESSPALHVLTIMCRTLAVMILLAELAGAVALVVGMSRAKEPASRSDRPATVAEEVERILAKSSAGLWSKIALLAAGAISIIALLTTAEMIQLAARMEQRAAHVEQATLLLQQTAGRVEQNVGRVEEKLENLSRK